MQSLIRRFSLFIYPIIFQLLGLSTPVMAREVNPYLRKVHGENDKLKVAVVELHDGKIKSDIVEKVTDTVRDELSQKARFEVLSKEITLSALNAPADFSPTSSSNSLNRYLDQAKEFYKTSNFKEAIGLLETTINNYRTARTLMTENFLLTDAYLMLGNVYMGSNNERRAEEAFQEAVRLDPDRELTEAEYPPKTVSMFRKCKKDFLSKAKSAILEIQSSPTKADVYLNGNLKGKTPLKFEQFRVGEHFILVKSDGYKPQAVKVQLNSKGSHPKFALEKSAERTTNMRRLTVSNLQNIPEQVRLASALGKLLGVNKVVLVSVEEIGWNNKITARMIDIKYQASHKHKSVEVLDLSKDTRSAANVIAANLEEIADLDLAKDPKKYAESDVTIIGSKKKKSFWKSPILWSIVGVVVAGGASSALLIGKGGSGGGDGNSTVSVSGSSSQAP